MASKHAHLRNRTSRSLKAPSSDSQSAQAQTQAEPWWHWLVAGVGAVLVLGTAGYLTFQSIHAPSDPPAITLSVSHMKAVPNGYVVVVNAHNSGGETAAGLKVTGVLKRNGQLLDQNEFTLDYLPASSSRHGGLFFTHDPQAAGVTLQLQPSGYSKP